ncbi:MAG: DMT family transporter [Burkholderiales bacterium]
MNAFALAPDPRQSTVAGIALAVAAVAFFAGLDTFTKQVSLALPILMGLWFRYIFQAVATTGILLASRGAKGLYTQHPRLHALRGLLLLVCSGLAFTSLSIMPVGEFTAVLMITPLVMMLVARLRFGERVSPLRWWFVAGGFAGTLLIVRPGSGLFNWTMLLPLTLVATNTWFQLLTSRLVRTEDPVTMNCYTGWVGATIATLALPFVWVRPGSWQLWAGLLMMGLLGTVGHYLLILAYQRAPASTLAPYLYAQIGFAMIGGYVAFAHVPDAVSLMGVALIALCGMAGVWLAAREKRAAPLVHTARPD